MKLIRKANINKVDISIFLIVILIFGGALIAFYPGLMTSDTVDQINQAINGEYIDAHPILHTFIIGMLYKTFNSIVAIAIFQIIFFAVIWTYSCNILRKESDTRLNAIFQILLTIIICIIPTNFMYSITLWKDILYSYALLGGVVYTYIGIKNKFNYTWIQMIFISIFLALVMRLRHNGLPIGLIMFIILLLGNAIKNRKIKSIMLFIGIFAITVIIFSMPKWILNKGNSMSASGTFTSTKIYCMGALLNQELNLEQEEYEFLNNIFPIDYWKEKYNSYSGTPILFDSNLNMGFVKENIEQFNSIFYKYAKMYPKVVIKHFVEANSIFWSIRERGSLSTVVTNNNNMDFMPIWRDEYTTNPKSEELNSIYNKILEKTTNNRVIYALLYRPATLMYLSLIIVFIIIYKTKKISYILLVFPMGLNIGTYLPFISSQDQRYAYPSFVTCYFLILLLLTIISKKKLKNKNNKKVKMGKKNLIIIPAYNEEKSIKNVVNDIQKNIDNCDVLIVNDGSKDNTLREAKKTSAIVIDLSNNLGIGGAVQTGYLYAYKNGYDVAIQVDADGQHNPKYISEMIDIIQKREADMVIGSRFIEKTTYKQTFFSIIGIKITSWIINLLTDTKIYDTTSGFRAINKEIIEEFATNYPYDYPEPCTNMEMILKGKKIKEIPVEMNKRTTGVSSISPLKSIKYMLKVILSLFLMRIKKY